MPRVQFLSVILGTLLLTSAAVAGPPGGRGGKPPKDDPPPEPPAAPINYQYVEFTLGGPSARGIAYGINDLGEVVGNANVTEGVQHAFVYTDRYSADGTFLTHDLNNLVEEYIGEDTGWELENAGAVNENGWIVGEGFLDGVQNVPFCFLPPVLDETGDTLVAAEIFAISLPGMNGFGWDISEHGDAVSDSFLGSAGSGRGVTVFTDATGPVDVGIFGNVPVRAINNDLMIVGATGGFTTPQAYVYDFATDQLTYLPLLGPAEGSCVPKNDAWDINNAGLVVGWSTTASIKINKKRSECGPRHAFAWSASTGIEDLGTLGGPESWAFSVNDAGDIVGTTTDATGRDHVFLHADEFDGMISVTDGILNPRSDVRTLVPRGINSQRVIVGQFHSELTSTGADTAAFMLVPVIP